MDTELNFCMNRCEFGDLRVEYGPLEEKVHVRVGDKTVGIPVKKFLEIAERINNLHTTVYQIKYHYQGETYIHMRNPRTQEECLELLKSIRQSFPNCWAERVR